jgi:MFS family permease
VFGFLGCLFAAPAGVLFDRYGASSSLLLPLGCVVYVAAFVGLAWCRTYAQFMGCMVVAGVAAGTCFFPTVQRNRVSGYG